MADTTKVAKNTFYLYLKTGFTLIIMLYTTRVVLRALGASDFGVYNVVAGAISMMGFLSQTMATSLQRFFSYEEGRGNKSAIRQIFSIGMLIHFVLALVLVVVLCIVGLFLFNGILNIIPERRTAAIIVYSGLIVSTVFSVLSIPYDAILNAKENMLFYSIIGCVEALLKLAVAITIDNSTSDRLIVYGILMGSIPIITAAVMAIYCLRNYEECKWIRVDISNRGKMKEILSFAGWRFLGASSNLLGNHGNNIALNHFFGTVINTVTGIANQVNGILLVLTNGMMKAVSPVIIKAEGEGHTEIMLKYSLLSCKYSFLLFAVFAIPFMVETPFMLNLWLGDYPYWTVLFVRLQLLRALLEQLMGGLGKPLEAKGKIKEINKICFFLNLLPVVVLTFIYKCGGAPYWHFIVAIPLMTILVSLVNIYYSHKHCGLNYGRIANKVLYPCMVIAAMATFATIVPSLFQRQSFVRLACCTLGCVTVLTATSYFYMEESEKQFVMSKIKIRCRK